MYYTTNMQKKQLLYFNYCYIFCRNFHLGKKSGFDLSRLRRVKSGGFHDYARAVLGKIAQNVLEALRLQDGFDLCFALDIAAHLLRVLGDYRELGFRRIAAGIKILKHLDCFCAAFLTVKPCLCEIS